MWNRLTGTGIGRRIGGFALLAALSVALVACAGAEGQEGPAGPPGPAGPAGADGPAGAGLEPMTRHYEVSMVDFRVVATDDEGMQVSGNMWNWAPNVIVAHRGDTVHLTVNNPQDQAHSLRFPDIEDLETGRLAAEQSEDLTFEATEAGVFVFRCGLRYQAEEGDCTPDHGRQVGYLIVLDR